jgi:ATP dependent DNA ligase domain
VLVDCATLRNSNEVAANPVTRSAPTKSLFWALVFIMASALWASSSIGRTNDRLPILTILASGSHLDHGEGDGRLLFEQIAQMDLEGIVCKRKDSPYKVTEKPSRHWIKVKNSRYSQLEGRGVV